MKTFWTGMLLLAGTGPLWGQTGATPQTARQALIEMFFSPAPGTFTRHLPAATLNALGKAGGLTQLQQYSALASMWQKGKMLETFETGSILLAAKNPQTQQAFEILVDNDQFNGDEDNLELSFQTTQAGKLEKTPFLPKMAFLMKQESGTWRLHDISITLRLPLADPDFLKGLTEGIKARAAASSAISVSQGVASSSPGANTTAVPTAMRGILTAEQTYATSYPKVGYTCSLTDLDGFGGGDRNEHQAMLISSSLASGHRYGYVFQLSGCTTTPASTFRLTGSPNGSNGSGARAFCTDQTGTMRYSDDGNPATCLVSGPSLP